jgi:hypothetical protein
MARVQTKELRDAAIERQGRLVENLRKKVDKARRTLETATVPLAQAEALLVHIKNTPVLEDFASPAEAQAAVEDNEDTPENVTPENVGDPSYNDDSVLV